MGKLFDYGNVHAVKPGYDAVPLRDVSKGVKRAGMKTLLNRYLCMGKDSPCVTKRACECLDVCWYGQEYIRQTGNKEGKKNPAEINSAGSDRS